MSNKISVIIDVTVDRANQALSKFRTSVADADGAVGKFKAGAGAAMDSVKANAGNLAMAGGAALVAFGAKAVSEFNKLAIEAGKMSDALGMPVEDMSRLIEVAGDLGIETSSLESTIGRMNRTASSTPGYFSDINAEIVKNADGTTNVNETFLATVDALNRIPDATKRAEAAQRIFGRSWQDIAELVGQGADDIRQSLADVSDQKVIDEDEVEKARRFRAAMDELADAGQDVALLVGEELTPILTDFADALGIVRNAAETVSDILPGPLSRGLSMVTDQVKRSFMPWRYVTDAVSLFGDETEEVAETSSFGATVFDDLRTSVIRAADAIDGQTNIMSDAEIAAGRLANRTADVTEAFSDLRGELSDRSAYLDLQDAFDNLLAKGLEAFDGTVASAREYERAQIDATEAVLAYIEEVGNVPAETQTELLALIDEGAFEEVERRLASLERVRVTQIAVSTAKPDTYTSPAKISGARASGGPVGAGRTYLVGEQGPELLQMGSQSGNVIPNDQLGGSSSGGGSTFNLTVNAGMGANGPQIGAEIVRYLKEWERRNGPGWRSS